MRWLWAIPFFWFGLAAYVPVIMAFRDAADDWTNNEVLGALQLQFIGNICFACGTVLLVIFLK